MLTAGFAALHGMNGASGPTIIPTWTGRYSHADAPLERYHRRVRSTTAIAVAGGVVLVAALMVWIGATNGSPRIGGVPAAAMVILIAGVVALFVRIGSQLPHLRERSTARRHGIRAFAIGTFPLTRTYLVVAPSGLALLRGRSAPICRIAWTDVEIVALATSRAAVGMSRSVQGQWHDIPIVLEVGGPSASAYSSSPIGAQSRLLSAVQSAIEPHALVHVESR